MSHTLSSLCGVVWLSTEKHTSRLHRCLVSCPWDFLTLGTGKLQDVQGKRGWVGTNINSCSNKWYLIFSAESTIWFLLLRLIYGSPSSVSNDTLNKCGAALAGSKQTWLWLLPNHIVIDFIQANSFIAILLLVTAKIIHRHEWGSDTWFLYCGWFLKYSTKITYSSWCLFGCVFDNGYFLYIMALIIPQNTLQI